MTATPPSPSCSWLLLAASLLLVANTTVGAFRATAALELERPATDSDELVVFFDEVQTRSLWTLSIW